MQCWCECGEVQPYKAFVLVITNCMENLSCVVNVFGALSNCYVGCCLLSSETVVCRVTAKYDSLWHSSAQPSAALGSVPSCVCYLLKCAGVSSLIPK